ncbi:large ribosomal subunit protein bL32m [Stomoxys calcitrans]|uniref:Large ribosomal subunit protein bL32m n=1 Tax=Stomoxys calcitrans TaxID=35570 RepID=A0A1I8NYS6_STOCA|nr:large ribosomal subunit protein bL32m [Stomoxys calcitrans]
MSRNLVLYFSNFLQRLESVLPALFQQGSLPPAFALAGLPSVHEKIRNQNTPTRSLKDIIGDGILWAVPKHRRTLEKRLNRKFGYPEYNWKPLRVKTNLRSCNQCGHDYEAGHLCPHCYNKVREETQQMQDKIQEELGLQPVEQEVVVLYEGERKEQPSEMLNGKRIVEMPKPRPMWFTKNLLQKTTQQPSNSKEVKPNDLA